MLFLSLIALFGFRQKELKNQLNDERSVAIST